MRFADSEEMRYTDKEQPGRNEREASTMDAEQEPRAKSVQKAIDILNCFVKKQPLGITEISEMTGYYKSNVHTIVHTLTSNGLLERDAESEKYYLGLGTLRLGRAVGDRYTLRNVASVHMNRLANEIGESVYLYVPLRDQIYTLLTASPVQSRYYRPSASEGFTCRMHCTGAGKVILAFQPRELTEAYIAGGLERYTDKTIVSPELLRQELARVRRDRMAMDNMEWDDGMRCISVPIFGSSGTLMGAMSVSSPALVSADEETLRSLVRRLTECAGQIEANL